MTTDFDAWVEAARSVPIESVLTRRGIHLRKSGIERIGPCPKCGGTDRFSINVKEGVWNCRGCKPEGISGDVIGLVEWLDGVDFKTAVETLEGTRFNGGGNGKANGNGHAFNHGATRAARAHRREYHYTRRECATCCFR